MYFFCGDVNFFISVLQEKLNYRHYPILLLLPHYFMQVILPFKKAKKWLGKSRKFHKQEVFSFDCFKHKGETMQQSRRKSVYF